MVESGVAVKVLEVDTAVFSCGELKEKDCGAAAGAGVSSAENLRKHQIHLNVNT